MHIVLETSDWFGLILEDGDVTSFFKQHWETTFSRLDVALSPQKHSLYSTWYFQLFKIRTHSLTCTTRQLHLAIWLCLPGHDFDTMDELALCVFWMHVHNSGRGGAVQFHLQNASPNVNGVVKTVCTTLNISSRATRFRPTSTNAIATAGLLPCLHLREQHVGNRSRCADEVVFPDLPIDERLSDEIPNDSIAARDENDVWHVFRQMPWTEAK